MNAKKLLPVLLTFIFLTGADAQAQALKTKPSLPRSVPEAEGVVSQGIMDFLDAAADGRHEFHSFMFLRHGKVIAEGWWNPYRADLKHTMYSTSKSFTSTAIGFAVSEKRLSVNDKVVSFFPGELPKNPPPYLMEMTVKHLLSMTAGHDPDPTSTITTGSEEWVRAFLATPITERPGTTFLYNSMCTYMLSAIVQKVTGQRMIDYLRPRLFEPLGIHGMDWESDPKGINKGGWGLRVRTEDMAKLGQLYLQKGKWNGRQILPESWIAEATSAQIDSRPRWLSKETKREDSDWAQGYGYQFWRCRNNAYRADGAFGQYIIVFPEKDAVIAITSETSSMQDQINLVWKHLLPAMQTRKLPLDRQQSEALRQKLAALSLPPLADSKASPMAQRLSGKTVSFSARDGLMETISFAFQGDTLQIGIKGEVITHQFQFGLNSWKPGETSRRSPYLAILSKADLAAIAPLRVAGSYRWKDEKTLEILLRYIETPHSERLTFVIDGDALSLMWHESPDFQKQRVRNFTGRFVQAASRAAN